MNLLIKYNGTLKSLFHTQLKAKTKALYENQVLKVHVYSIYRFLLFITTRCGTLTAPHIRVIPPINAHLQLVRCKLLSHKKNVCPKSNI